MRPWMPVPACFAVFLLVSAVHAGTAMWGEAELVFVAKLDEAIAGPVAQSFPPIHNHTLRLTVERSLRGQLKEAAKVSAHHAARQEAAPVFPVGQRVLVAASNAREGFAVLRIEACDDKLLAAAEAACSLPLGWTMPEGKTLSPWAALGKKAWTAETDLKGKLSCSATGRPALLADVPGLVFVVEHVPPKKDIQWTNPDGDGAYRITVSNSTDKPIAVPALLSDGKEILWAESLVILCQGKAHPCPGAKGVTGKVQATTIPAGQSVSTVVNALRLEGPAWPQGGYRIEFQFCLGELGRTKSFYYMSRHHDPIRAASKAKA